MKRIIDLNEEDIKRIVLRVIKEEETNTFKDALMGIANTAKSSFQKLMDELQGKTTDSSGTSSDKSSSSSDSSSSSPISTKKISAKGQQLLNDPLFKQKLKDISDTIGIDQNSIIKLMNHESGLNPSVKNPGGCVGLIQFCPDRSGGNTKTIGGKTYMLSDLQNDLELQMKAIKEFWSTAKRSGKIKTPEDLYIYNFIPAMAGKSDDTTVEYKGASAETVANSNPVFNKKLGRPKSTPLTVGDLKKYYRLTGMI